MYINYKNCLTNLSNSVLKHFNVSTYHNTLDKLDKILDENNSKNVVVLLFDGLGARVIDKLLGKENILNDNKKFEIDSVFPTTTAAATTTVMSGLNPNEHGWIGWNVYLKEINKTVTLFLNEEKNTKEKFDYPVAKTLLGYKSVVKRINEESKYDAYYISPFGSIKYELDENDTKKTLNDMVEVIKEYTNKEGKKYLYVYNDQPDATLHDYGFGSKEANEVINNIVYAVKRLQDELEDTTLIITADHGHLQSERIDLLADKKLCDLLSQTTSVDSRCVSFFVKEGLEEEFVKEFEKYLDDFDLLTKKEVLDNNLFGVGPDNKHFNGALGTFLAVAKSNKYFDDQGHDFKSHHAGVTEDEIKVPVIVITKK